MEVSSRLCAMYRWSLSLHCSVLSMLEKQATWSVVTVTVARLDVDKTKRDYNQEQENC